MTSENIYEKLFALFRLSSEQLTEFFKVGSFDGFSIKHNEFQVFCAFWVTACYLRSTEKPLKEEIESFNKSVIVTIVDGIIDSQPEDLDKEKVNALNDTITNVFVERFANYREFFQADLGQRENDHIRLFPRLVEGFLVNVLDREFPANSPTRQLLDSTLENLLKKSSAFFAD